MVTNVVWLTEPEVAVTVTAPGIEPAVNVAPARPAEVEALAGESLPMALLLRLNVTLVPFDTLPPFAVVTVADRAVVPDVRIEFGVAIRVIAAAGEEPELPPPVLLLLLPPPHPTKIARNPAITINRILPFICPSLSQFIISQLHSVPR
jgi:hypothetical protein